MAGYLLIARRQGESLPVFAFSGIACAVGAAVLLGGAVAAGIPIAVPSMQAFGFIVLSALIPQLIGHGLLTWALRHVRPTVVGLATVGEPVGATILAWIWLGETPGLGTAIGCMVTVFAVALAVSRGATQGTGPGPGSPSL
jgi:drug/metabolite transporter (DMT)-like permease